MTISTRTLANHYADAMRLHLDATRPDRTAAGKLGELMRESGLNSLDLVQMHGRAVTSLATDYNFMQVRHGKRAAIFFKETLLLLDADHRLRSKPQAQMKKHAAELALGNRKLRKEVARRILSEEALKSSLEHNQSLLIQSQVAQANLRGLAHKILSAQEDERREISRELHDTVVQTLVGINVQLASLGRAASIGTKTLKARIASTQRLVEKSVSGVHQFARELRPSVLDDLGLIPALHAYMRTVTARKKMRIELTAAESAETLDSNKRTVLYRVAQEALINIGRHAHATIVTVSILELPGKICMELHDDGRSFNVKHALSSKTNKRLGLLGMRERVEMVGGTLTIESSPGFGTTVRATLPFAVPGAPPP